MLKKSSAVKKTKVLRLAKVVGLGIVLGAIVVGGVALAAPTLTGKCSCDDLLFAIPLPNVGSKQLVGCQQNYHAEPPFQMCAYTDGTFCSIAVDVVGEENWRGQDIDCKTGEPVNTKTAF